MHGQTNQKKVLITGGSGTLGFNVCRLLSGDSRYQLFIPLRRDHPELFSSLINCRVFILDLADRARLAEVMDDVQPHTVIHIAASGLRPPKPIWFEMVTFNVEATLRLFEASCAIKDCHFIYISSGLVYRELSRPLCETDPMGSLHPYGASKAAADFLLRAAAAEFGKRLTVLRPFSFTGVHDAGDRLFPSLFRAALERKAFPLTDGVQVRDFSSVGDIARAVALSIEYSPSEAIEIINLGSGEALTIRETVERAVQELNLTVDLRFGLRDYHPHEPKYLVADISKAERLLGWRPRQPLSSALWELVQSQFPMLPIAKPRVFMEVDHGK
jgi:nucleoside-diphosphate-sugar epimerase